MKKFNSYEAPEIEVVSLNTEDVIATSVGDTSYADWEW